MFPFRNLRKNNLFLRPKPRLQAEFQYIEIGLFLKSVQYYGFTLFFADFSLIFAVFTLIFAVFSLHLRSFLRNTPDFVICSYTMATTWIKTPIKTVTLSEIEIDPIQLKWYTLTQNGKMILLK